MSNLKSVGCSFNRFGAIGILTPKNFEFLDEFFNPKTRVLGLSVGEDFVILACLVFTQCQRLMDGQTDRQTAPIVASTGLA